MGLLTDTEILKYAKNRNAPMRPPIAPRDLTESEQERKQQHGDFIYHQIKEEKGHRYND